MDCSIPGFPVLHYFLEFAQTHVHWVDDIVIYLINVSIDWYLSFQFSPIIKFSVISGFFKLQNLGFISFVKPKNKQPVILLAKKKFVFFSRIVEKLQFGARKLQQKS